MNSRQIMLKPKTELTLEIYYILMAVEINNKSILGHSKIL